MKKIFLPILFLLVVSYSRGQSKTADKEKIALSIASTAQHFLKTLSKDQLQKITYSFDSDERTNWAFVPTSRNGISLKELNSSQNKAAMELLKQTLSEQGYQKAIGIIQLEIILKELEKRKPEDHYRDPTNYYFTIFGKPSDAETWGWRIEGHHLALNFVASAGKIVSSTPTFMGSNPGIVPEGAEKGKQILKPEVDLAFELLHSFSESQLKKAVISETAFPEIMTGNSRKANLEKIEGLPFAEMTKDQQHLFLKLVSVYVKNYPFGFSDELMQKIEKAGLENLHFAWAGSKNWGAGHYYRIHNAVFLVEYDNTQNNGNHIHTSVRDLTNDFGEDFLKEHYKKDHLK